MCLSPYIGGLEQKCDLYMLYIHPVLVLGQEDLTTKFVWRF